MSTRGEFFLNRFWGTPQDRPAHHPCPEASDPDQANREARERTATFSCLSRGLVNTNTRGSTSFGRLAGLTLLSLLGAAVVWGSVTASISGTVRDTSGAVIPGASVVVVNAETGVKNSTQTDARGFYSFPALPVGQYSVHIEVKGFEAYRQTGLTLNINTALRVDVALEVGAVTQQVTVSSTVLHVDTSSNQMGDVIAAAKMTAVPLNGRSFTDLLALQPGVAPVSTGESGAINVSGNLDPGNLSISGQRENANGFMVNGGSAEERDYNAAAIVPDLDSIAEFRILTNNADAEYGGYSGGLVNVVTKSGTNQFHGDAFDFLRNPDFDSRNFYSPARAVYHQNQFGGTVGGPIRHDKVFFFADYQGTRMVQGVDTGLIAVPSAAERQGNMMGVASLLTGTVNGQAWANTLSQELGYSVASGEPYYTAGCASSSQCVFPGAQIPQRAFSVPATKLMQYIPLPNSGSYFTTSAYDETLGDDKGSMRLDANSRLGMLTGYYFIDNYNLVNPYGGASVPGFSSSNNGRAQMFNLGDTKSLSPDSVNVLHLVYMRDANITGEPIGGLGVSLASQGFTGIYPMQTEFEGVESVDFNNFSIGAADDLLGTVDNTYEVNDNYSKVFGTHTLGFGGSFGYYQTEYNFHLNLNGGFGFSGTETGLDFADFLIGAPSTYSQGLQLPMYGRSREYDLYGQDSWRATPHLTLNGGLRWEVSTPWWEAHNQIEALVPGCQSKVFPGAPTGWCFPGDPGIPSTISPIRYNDFAPRLGLVYSPGDHGGLLGKTLGGAQRTSIRTAYGIYYSSFGQRIDNQESGDAPFGYWWASPAPPLFATPFVDRSDGINRGQRFPVPVPPLNVSATHPDSSINWSQFEPLSSSPGWETSNRLPYSEDYNFTIERQFGSATLLSLSYVGEQAHRLVATMEANTGNPALCLGLSQPSDVLPGTATCGPYGENGTYYPVTGGIITTTRAPFNADFGSDGYDATIANSNYNAFEATLRHTAHRMEVLLSYTFSKSLDNASGEGLGQGDNINPINPKITKALSAFDVANNFVTSYSYQIPFDKLWRSRLTRGWLVGGVTRFATGFPVYVWDNSDNSLLGTFSTGQGNPVDEPNFTPGKILDNTNPRSGLAYFNTSLFSQEFIGRLGNSNRRFFTGPGINDWDIALRRDFHITESKTLEFRGEFFNAFNHAQFNDPDGDFVDSTFGLVLSAQPARVGQLAIKFLF